MVKLANSTADRLIYGEALVVRIREVAVVGNCGFTAPRYISGHTEHHGSVILTIKFVGKSHEGSLSAVSADYWISSVHEFHRKINKKKTYAKTTHNLCFKVNYKKHKMYPSP